MFEFITKSRTEQSSLALALRLQWSLLAQTEAEELIDFDIYTCYLIDV